MKATERGIEMLHMPMNELPPIAVEFKDKLAREAGLCIETCLTAYAVYAYMVEGAECDDELYRPRMQDFDWFLVRGFSPRCRIRREDGMWRAGDLYSERISFAGIYGIAEAKVMLKPDEHMCPADVSELYARDAERN